MRHAAPCQRITEKLTLPKADRRAAEAAAANFLARCREFTVVCKFITVNEL